MSTAQRVAIVLVLGSAAIFAALPFLRSSVDAPPGMGDVKQADLPWRERSDTGKQNRKTAGRPIQEIDPGVIVSIPGEPTTNTVTPEPITIVVPPRIQSSDRPPRIPASFGPEIDSRRILEMIDDVPPADDVSIIRPPQSDSFLRPPQKYTIRDGDTLSSLAERFLGDPHRSDEILNENREILSASGALPLGLEIVIPNGR